ncbi:MAG: hypothetical protein QXF97_08260, partial [Candidatus Caldarchaeum sp.]
TRLIICCMSVFNEAEWIERAILSVGNHVDRIIILDGAYENFMKVNNLDFFLSNDETREKIARAAAHVTASISFIQPERPWRNELEKRSYFFNYGWRGDWFFILDGNEECVGDVAAGMSQVRQLDAFAAAVKVVMPDGQWFTPHRFLSWQPKMRYERNHWTIKGKWYGINFVSADPDPYPLITDFHIVNHSHTGVRREMRDRYVEFMNKRGWAE